MTVKHYNEIRRRRKVQRRRRPIGYYVEALILSRIDLTREELRGLATPSRPGVRPEIRSKALGSVRLYSWVDALRAAERLDRGVRL